jgi:23S rRNA pseudouridine1911/1915/1917 synthase
MSDTRPAEEHTFQAAPEHAGERLDKFLAGKLPDRSRTALVRQIRLGNVRINGRTDGAPPRPAHRLEPGDTISVSLEALTDPIAEPEDIELVLLYEDDRLIAVDKPPGMTVHPGSGNRGGTLANALAFRFEQLSSAGGAERPGIVHRLDKDTSGVILVAKDDAAHEALSSQFRLRTVHKEYLAVVRGVPELDSDLVTAPLGPHRRHPTRRDVRLDIGKAAETLWEVEERFDRHALVRCRPRSGRTHQIRVHLSHIGHPILSDRSYGGTDGLWLPVMPRQALHAHRIRFAHPSSGEELQLESPIPADLLALLAALRAGGPPERA